MKKTFCLFWVVSVFLLACGLNMNGNYPTREWEEDPYSEYFNWWGANGFPTAWDSIRSYSCSCDTSRDRLIRISGVDFPRNREYQVSLFSQDSSWQQVLNFKSCRFLEFIDSGEITDYALVEVFPRDEQFLWNMLYHQKKEQTLRIQKFDFDSDSLVFLYEMGGNHLGLQRQTFSQQSADVSVLLPYGGTGLRQISLTEYRYGIPISTREIPVFFDTGIDMKQGVVLYVESSLQMGVHKLRELPDDTLRLLDLYGRELSPNSFEFSWDNDNNGFADGLWFLGSELKSVRKVRTWGKHQYSLFYRYGDNRPRRLSWGYELSP